MKGQLTLRLEPFGRTFAVTRGTSRIAPCRVVIMASERMEDGEVVPNHSAREVHATAARLSKQLHRLLRRLPSFCQVCVRIRTDW